MPPAAEQSAETNGNCLVIKLKHYLADEYDATPWRNNEKGALHEHYHVE